MSCTRIPCSVVLAAVTAALAGCYEDPPRSHPCDACLPCESCVEGADGARCEATSHESESCVGTEVHWLDSCGADEGTEETCPLHATCEADGAGGAACACTNHWTGAGCDECPGHWDAAEDCGACEGNWDPSTGCAACLPNWTVESGCAACAGNWDSDQDCTVCETNWEDDGDDCGTCPGNWDPAADCSACRNHWIGEAGGCVICPGNWDSDQDCGACRNAWTGADCDVCPANWDSDQDCAACTNHWTTATCDHCPGNWDPDQNCAVCANHWVDASDDCGTCPGNWDSDQACAACRNHWTDTDCGTCPGNWDPAADCGACLGNWDPAAGCATCLNHWVDDSDGCGTCPGNWDEAGGCVACANHWIDEGNDCGTCEVGYRPEDDCAEVCGNGHLEPDETCEDGNAVDWDGCNDCAIAEFTVDALSETERYTLSPSAGVAADGSFVVTYTWQPFGAASSVATGVYGQRFTSDGLRDGDPFQINTYTGGDFGWSKIAMAPDGRFVVAWVNDGEDGSGDGVFGQLFDASGAAVGGEFQVNATTSGSQSFQDVARDSAGRFVVLWKDTPLSGSDDNIYGQRYDADGSALGTEFVVNSSTTGEHDNPRLDMDAAGAFVVIWHGTIDGHDGSYWVFGRLFGAGGTPAGDEFQVSAAPVAPGYAIDVELTTAGGFFATWTDESGLDGSAEGIYGGMYDSDGALVGAELRVNTTTEGGQYAAQMTSYAGGFAVFWHDSGADGSSTDLYGQRFDAAGIPVGDQFRVNVRTEGNQFDPSAAAMPDGRLVVTWNSSVPELGALMLGSYAQRYDTDGNPMGVLPW